MTYPILWDKTSSDALLLTLGDPKDNQRIDSQIESLRLNPDNTVLIGGPPCQAYSLVGRARNKGNSNYRAEDDSRHFLYQEYLRLLKKITPAIFVMENVKGILSSKVGGEKIFPQILTDLSNPAKASEGKAGARYRIHSLVAPVYFGPDMDPEEIDTRRFVIKSEEFGIPQMRHRVILIGVREDLWAYPVPQLTASEHQLQVSDAIADLPSIRSHLSRADSEGEWLRAVNRYLEKTVAQMARKRPTLSQFAKNIGPVELPDGLVPIQSNPSRNSLECVKRYRRWVEQYAPKTVLNHSSRGHMASDLGRYFYAASFAMHYGSNPKGATDFNAQFLAPKHANWQSGTFVDRFKVQRWDVPGSTVTSHISKDGNYFIHPDPRQCRSLSVREAARIQSFPDSYYFEGGRTAQYHQVGNAVPPLLAYQIADVVHQILQKTQSAPKKKKFI
jgi:DNA (cytosine-5)-methyltransferase 1